MRIKVVDQNELERTQAYFRGWDRGVFGTLKDIIYLHKSGTTLKQIYKHITNLYNEYCGREIDENNSQRN